MADSLGVELFNIFGRVGLQDDDTAGKLKNISNIGQSTSNNLVKAFDKIRSTALKVGSAIGVGLTLKSVIDNTSEAQEKLSQMDAVLKSTGDASGMTKTQLIELAESQGKVTTYSKDTNIAAENMLLTFTHIGKNVFPDVLKASNDMATALGTDDVNAAMQVGKALNDPAEGISRLTREGVTFSAAQQQQIKSMEAVGNTAGAQKIMLQELEKEFGGSAVAAGQTFGGQMKILKNNIDEVGISIASTLLPHIQNFISNINTHMPQIQSTISTVISTITPPIEGIIKDVGQIASNLLPSLGKSSTDVQSKVLALVKSGLNDLKSVFDWLSQHGTLVKAALIAAASGFAAFKTVSTIVSAINNLKKGFEAVSIAAKTVKGGFETARIAGMLFNDNIKTLGSGLLSGAKSLGTFILGLGKSTAATKVQAAAQAVLNAVMNANPIAIVVIAIAGLVTALVILYNKNKAFRDFINTMFSDIKNWVGNCVNFIQSHWQQVPHILTDAVDKALTNLNGKIGQFNSWAKSAGDSIVKGFDSVINFFKNLPKNALNWGKDMIQGFIDGILSKIGNVGEAANKVGAKIKSFLHFSHPEEGEMQNYETWMPDFMTGLSQGITNNIPKIKEAANQVTTEMQNILNPKLNLGIGNQVISAESGISNLQPVFQGGDITLQINGNADRTTVQELDQFKDEIAQKIATATQQGFSSGMNRMIRNAQQYRSIKKVV